MRGEKERQTETEKESKTQGDRGDNKNHGQRGDARLVFNKLDH